MQNFRKFREVPLMSRPSSRSSSDPQNNALLVVAMLAMVAVPAGIALHTVRIPAPTQIPPADATPYGYTVSLLLFIIPIIVIGIMNSSRLTVYPYCVASEIGRA